MNIDTILSGLNAAQRDAVTTKERIVRVIAGAGSGKTRVLVQRMQWLMTVAGCMPYQLLALTFTNKAAQEMRQRLEQSAACSLNQLWMGTFHSICLRILRQYAELVGWEKSFIVIDSDDQLRLIKRLLQKNNWNEEILSAKAVQAQINAYKENGLRAADLPTSAPPLEIAVHHFYQEYEHITRQQGTMDFAELLLLTTELLAQHETVQQRFHQRFQAILIDEFQDTNTLQFKLVTQFCAPKTQLFVVGDDDQSIYGWRGAQIDHIVHLERYYPTVHTIRLEQNYRSTKTILAAANTVIAHNQTRLGKTLWSDGKHGEAIALYAAVNEYDEARYLVENIAQFHQHGGAYDQCAILYRSNALSRIYEEALIQKNIPYRIYGGLRFFERAEIKDALAYLRLLHYPDDDAALERIINQPPRGIGAKTMEDVRLLAQRVQCSLWRVITDDALLEQKCSARAQNALRQFRALIIKMTAFAERSDSLRDILKMVVDESGLYAALTNNNQEETENRRENLHELIAAGDYQSDQNDADHDKIADFLAMASLDAGDKETNAHGVQLMTLHSAKGLEFNRVYMVALEEGLFPNARSLENSAQLEEERRLAYVGITRAREQLTMSFAERRRYYGQDNYARPSRFLNEIPPELLNMVRPVLFNRTQPNDIQEDNPWETGVCVQHAQFGTGVIQAVEGSGEHQRALVKFTTVGEKWLVLAYAKLKIL